MLFNGGLVSTVPIFLIRLFKILLLFKCIGTAISKQLVFLHINGDVLAIYEAFAEATSAFSLPSLKQLSLSVRKFVCFTLIKRTIQSKDTPMAESA